MVGCVAVLVVVGQITSCLRIHHCRAVSSEYLMGNDPVLELDFYFLVDKNVVRSVFRVNFTVM